MMRRLGTLPAVHSSLPLSGQERSEAGLSAEALKAFLLSAAVAVLFSKSALCLDVQSS